MAIKHEKECYTKWTHVENGKVLVRRIHRIEIQARNGLLYRVDGDKLPDFIGTCAGQAHKGAHLAQILLKPEAIPKWEAYQAAAPHPWPSFRDFVNAGLGFFAFVIVKFVASLIEACL